MNLPLTDSRIFVRRTLWPLISTKQSPHKLFDLIGTTCPINVVKVIAALREAELFEATAELAQRHSDLLSAHAKPSQ